MNTDLRKQIVEDLRLATFGPSTSAQVELRPSEIPPSDTYFYGCGVLCKPQAVNTQTNVCAETDVAGLSNGESDIGYVDENFLATKDSPSAVGFSFCARMDAVLSIDFSYTESIKNEGEYSLRPIESKRFESIAIPATVGVCNVPESNGLLRIRTRKVHEYNGNNYALVTVSLVNDSSANTPGDIYQTALSCCVGDSSVLLPLECLDSSDHSRWPEDRKLQALLYRHAQEYCVGHGCAAHLDLNSGVIRVEYLPVTQVDSVQHCMEGLPSYTMRQLGKDADSDWAQNLLQLAQLTTAYEEWIVKEWRQTSAIPDYLQSTSESNRKNCEEALARMKAGIKTLQQNATIAQAFRWTNQIMREQHLRSKNFKNVTPANRCGQLDDIVKMDHGNDEPAWRPFQLGFLLMYAHRLGVCPLLETPPDVDLIWFPTGGGKTEAYQAVSALTILYYRMLNPKSGLRTDGTLVIMRYTLRLLAQQQCDRALAMISCLDRLRQVNVDKFGEAPITLGFWAGSGASFNRYADAIANRDNVPLDGRFVISTCPHCGAPIRLRTDGANANGVLRYHCTDNNCIYRAGPCPIPFQSVDECLYRNPPTFLMGTVDKFAMLAEKVEARVFFGFQDIQAKTPTHVPPRLIIQDELHLLNSALGSIVGAYERAIALLCSGRHVVNGVLIEKPSNLAWPMILGATATTNQSNTQCLEIYQRNCRVFPPPALEAGNTFFSQVDRTSIGRRMYAGCMLPRISGGAAQTIAAAALLASAHTLPLRHNATIVDSAHDSLMSLLVYFTTVRELASFHSREIEEVKEYFETFSKKLTDAFQPSSDSLLYLSALEEGRELSSRKDASDLRQTMDLLQQKHLTGKVDLVRCTNMIQVGLDVGRLNLMLMNKQPQTHAEYIQASSRVGRSPQAYGGGLVVNLLRPMAPRDRSHFEHFYHYHDTFYAQVEPSTVTVSSPQVAQRTAAAIAVILVRMLGAYKKTGTPHTDGMIQPILNYLKETGYPAAKELLNNFGTYWANHPDGDYHPGMNQDLQNQLLGRFANSGQQHPNWNTMQSMRDVDTLLPLNI